MKVSSRVKKGGAFALLVVGLFAAAGLVARVVAQKALSGRET